MSKYYLYHIAAFLVVAFLSVLTGCENRDEMNDTTGHHATLDVGQKLVRLTGDSTNIAGTVDVTSTLSEIQLKWNVPTGCNIDTSLTSLPVHNGTCHIPIKWQERTDSVNYAPQSKAFNVGVLVSAGDLCEYIHLIWADEVDSLKLQQGPVAITRAGDEMPAAEMITVTPPDVLNMDIVVGGAMYVDFSGIAVVIVDPSEIPLSTNIDRDSIDLLLKHPDAIYFKWKPEAPTTNFSTRINFSGGSITKRVNINYTVPYEEPLVWEFINSSIGDGNDIPSANAGVSVQVKTNKPWSLESPEGLVSPVPDNSAGIGIKSLTMNFTDNTSTNKRSVSLLVKSQGVLKETLTFMQMGTGDISTGTVFEFISADPVHNSTVSSNGESATFKVRTDYAWWIEVDGVKTSYPAGELGEKTGVISLPANPTTDYRIVNCIIGYDNMTAQTISYIQPGAGSDTGLTYVSSNLPAGNIPQAGGTYQFTFTGSYTGSVQMRVSLDGVAQTAGTAVTNKKPEVTVPFNSSVERNVTFEYKLDVGDWMALPTSTNRIQDAGNGGGDTQTLTYVSSNLPTGNIPAAGNIYTFNFEGGYTGQLRVSAIEETTGTVLFNGPIGTTHSPKVTIPANGATTTRNIKFQYRMIDVAGSSWIDLPASTKRIQNGNGTTPPEPGVTPSYSPITPEGDIPYSGGTYSCVFFNYVGEVYFRAISGQNRSLAQTSGTIAASGAAQLSLTIPKSSTKSDNQVLFQYSIDGTNWTTMETRTQLVTGVIFVSNGIGDLPNLIPTSGGTYTYTSQGTLTGTLTIFCKDAQNVVLSESKGTVGSSIKVNVPANTTGKTRTLFFYFNRPDIPLNEFYMAKTQQNNY